MTRESHTCPRCNDYALSRVLTAQAVFWSLAGVLLLGLAVVELATTDGFSLPGFLLAGSLGCFLLGALIARAERSRYLRDGDEDSQAD